jgi:DNA-binding transcriptional ArsR family regulator
VAAGLLVLAGLGGVLAAGADVPPTLALPPVHDGDRGRYEGTLEYADGTPAGSRAGHWEGLTFLWHRSEARLDADGVPHAARVLETATAATPGGDWTDAWDEWSLDAATGQTIRLDELWSASGNSGGLAATTGNWTTSSNATIYGVGGPLCGLRSSALGRDGDAKGDLWLDGACTEDLDLMAGGRTRFRFEGVDPVAGRTAFRYGRADGGPVHAWFAPGIAAPVQVLQPSVADGAVRDVLLRLRLVAWEAGTQPEGEVAVPPAGEVAPFAWSQYDPRLGLPVLPGHPFSHTEALDAVEHDPRGALDSFRAAHPAAYLLIAASNTGTEGPASWFQWQFVWTDGSALLPLMATKRWAGPVPGQGPTLANAGLPVVEIESWTLNVPASWLPDPGQRPRVQFATPESVMARWEVLSGNDGHAEGGVPVYGFGAWCQDGGCTETRAWSYAGRVHSDLGVRSTGRWDYLMVDVPDGPVRRFGIDSAVAVNLGVGGLHPLPPLDQVPEPAAPPPAPAELAATFLWSPAGAGTFAAAFLVAILTYLWPSLKPGAAALFSRIRPEDLPEHPTRQALLDAVAAQPGIHFQALCRALGKGRGVVGHHLSKLVEAGQVVAAKKGGFTCYFAKGGPTASLAAVTALKADGAQRLLQELLARPDRSGLELAQATGLSPSTVHYHLQRLQDAGLVAATARGRSLAMRPTSAGEEAARLGGLA